MSNNFDIHPMVIIDFRVFTYNILHHYRMIKANYDQQTCLNWLRAAWALNINRGFTGLPYFDHTVVVVDDSNPYWRTEYLNKLGFPLYKDGRKDKDDVWYEVAESGKQYICHAKSPYHYLSFTGYEADDIAAAITRINAPRLILLHTIDSDWSGLIKDGALKSTTLNNLIHCKSPIEPTVVWANQAHWTPRIRDEYGLKTWASARLKVNLDCPTHLWEIKAIQGDRSDNLPPGSPLCVIDLNEPPQEFDILNTPELRVQVEEVAHCYNSNTRQDHLTNSWNWFLENGFGIPLCEPMAHPVNI